MSFHKNLLGSENHPLTANPNATGAGYANIAARDADTSFHSTATNVNKMVRVDSPLSFYILGAITPVWLEFSSTGHDSFIDHSDTPAAYASNAGKVAQVNAGATAIEFGQVLTAAGTPTFASQVLTGGAANVSLGLSSTSAALQLNRLTTTQRDAMTPLEGMQIFNTTTNEPESYSGTAWITMMSPGNVLKVGTPVDNQVGVWTGDGTLEGDAQLLFDTSSNTLTIGAGFVGNPGGALIVDAFFAPSIEMKESDAAIDAGRWISTIDNVVLSHNVATDLGALTPYMKVTRSGVTVPSIEFTTPRLSTTAVMRSGDGTELLPAYSFLSDPDTGMRRVSANVLGFSSSGFDTLQLTADALAVNFLTLNAGADAAGEGHVTMTVNGTSTDRVLDVNAIFGINLNTGTGGGDVSMGKRGANSMMLVQADKGVGIGVPSFTGSTGEVLRMQDAHSGATRTRMTMRSPVNSNIVTLGINQTSVDSGSAFLTNESGTGLVFSTSAGEALRITGLNVTTAGTITANGVLLNVSKVGAPANNQVGVWTGDGTIEGDSNFLWDGAQLTLAGSIPSLHLDGSIPIFEMKETDGPTDGKRWVAAIESQSFSWAIGDDAETSQVNYFTVVRAGLSLTSIKIATPLLHIESPSADTVAFVRHQSVGTNPGVTNKFVGNRDPNGNITGAGGDEYFRGAAGESATYESKELTTGTGWHRRNVYDSTKDVEINTQAEYDAQFTAGVRTNVAGNTMYVNLQVTSAINRHVLTGGFDLTLSGGDTSEAGVEYTGSGTFVTGTGQLQVFDAVDLKGTASGTFIDLSGALLIDNETIRSWGSMGKVSNGSFICRRVALVNIVEGWEVEDVIAVLFNEVSVGASFSGTLMKSRNRDRLAVNYSAHDLRLTGFTATAVAFDLNLRSIKGSPFKISNVELSAGNLFKKTTVANATINSVADSAIAAGTITNSVDNGDGGTRHSCTTTYFDSEEVTISSKGKFDGKRFIFNVVAGVSFDTPHAFSIGALTATPSAGGTGYTSGDLLTVVGGTGTVSVFDVVLVSSGVVLAVVLVTAGAYTVKPSNPAATTGGTGTGCTLTVLYDDTVGTVNSERLAITIAPNHGIVVQDSLKVIGTNFYNGFVVGLNLPSADVLIVNGDFISTNTGAIERNVGLDQSDPRVNATNNFGFPDSVNIACAHVNDNSTANGAIVNNTFTDLVFGTVGAALVASSSMERWRLKSELDGTFEYFGNEAFDGLITFDFTVVSSGGTVNFRFKWQMDSGAGFVDLPDTVEALVAVGSEPVSVTKTFPLKAATGDRIRPQITRNSGTSGITTQYATIYATG